jgi:2,3-bisphosphoglycerate-independent phosphoglycerate mutase
VKYVVLIIDGAAGWPASAYGGRTSLETAVTPNLDRLAREGRVGVVSNVPDGMEASSAIACMSVMGFDPCLYYAGRGPIEAAAMGIELEPGQVAMRCNLVTIMDERMASYSAGNISSAESAELIAALQEALGDDRCRFYPGVGFRHILTVRDGEELLSTSFTPPHDIAGQPVEASMPEGPGAALALDLMERSKAILEGHPVNERRLARGKPPATQIWLFWPGMKPVEMPAFAGLYAGRKAALTSPVDLLKGLAVQTGVDFIDIPGVTDGPDNDYAGQMRAALAALADHDVVFVHVESPDEAGHAGDAAGKVEAIEKVDALMVPQFLEAAARGAPPRGRLAPENASAPASGPEASSGPAAPGGLAVPGAPEALDFRLLVLPDHPTPLEIRTHVAEPVPFIMWGAGFDANGASAYTEEAARATGFAVAPGHLLMSMFLG